MEKTLFSELFDYDAYDEAEIMTKWSWEKTMIKSISEIF